MGNKCFVTRLNGVVSNQNLRKLGHLVIDLVSGSNKFISFGNKSQGDILLTMLDGTIDHVTSGVTIVDSTHCIIPAGATVLNGIFTSSASQSVKVDLGNYYGLSGDQRFISQRGIDQIQYTQKESFSAFNPAEEMDLSLLADCRKLTTIYLRDANVKLTGDLSFIENLELTSFDFLNGNANSPLILRLAYLSNITTLQEILLENTKIPTLVGDITTFGSLVNLTTLRIAETNIAGTVESFVAAQIAAGRATCDGIAIGANMGNVTFNGSLITGSSAKTLSWTSASNITIV